MSYMVDALAAERAKGARFTTAYAFADYDARCSSRQRVRDGWLAKNVEPILYNKVGDHKLLSNTLVEWARIRTDPYQARTQVALNRDFQAGSRTKQPSSGACHLGIARSRCCSSPG